MKWEAWSHLGGPVEKPGGCRGSISRGGIGTGNGNGDSVGGNGGGGGARDDCVLTWI